jgi:dihydrofolate synthase/folylpolyglutamate synthase
MTYKETLDYLCQALPMYQNIGSSAYKSDLKNAFWLDDYFKSPHRSFRSIHVAGTNGKGSVCHMLASVLQSAGYRTGLFTSPHLIDFRERIKVDGKCISKQYVINFTRRYKTIFQKIKPSFFEMTVFMAFDYFKKSKVDIAIIEVGLGGRLDTTNLITPILSVITNIGFDHTQILGNTLQKIAREKAGIIKNTVPVIVGETQQETKPIFTEYANRNRCTIWFADEYYSPDSVIYNSNATVTWNLRECYQWNFKSVTLDLQGLYQKKNLPTVFMVLWMLHNQGIKINTQIIEKGLRSVVKRTGFQGRWQIIDYNPLVVCDIAHNKEGFEQVIGQIYSLSFQNLIFILGFVNDKLIEPIVSLLPRTGTYYLTEPSIPRAMKLPILEACFQKHKLHYIPCATVSEAYVLAIESASSNDLIYIGGSTFVVADFLSRKNCSNSF